MKKQDRSIKKARWFHHKTYYGDGFIYKLTQKIPSRQGTNNQHSQSSCKFRRHGARDCQSRKQQPEPPIDTKRSKHSRIHNDKTQNVCRRQGRGKYLPSWLCIRYKKEKKVDDRYLFNWLVNMVQDKNDRAVKNMSSASRDISRLFATNELSDSRK